MTETTQAIGKNGFAFGEIVEVLIELYGFDPSKRDTFIGRLQQLQRLGIPPRANVGRGSKVRYDASQLLTVVMSLDMLDCGATPATLANYFSEKGGIEELFSTSGANFGHPVDTAAEGGVDLFFLFQPNVLGYLEPEGTERADDDRAVLRIEGHHKVVDRISDKPSIALNITRRIADVRAAVAIAAPHRATELVFGPLETTKDI